MQRHHSSRDPDRPGGCGRHPGGGSRHLFALALLWCACASPAAPPPDNPIDRLLAPKLDALGLSLRSPEPYELCRRISIDLLGRGPTRDELSACVAAEGAERIELAQDSPDYVRNARRVWSELLDYDVVESWGPDLADLDATVAELAAGRLGYAEFATIVVTHPGFLALHPEDDWAQTMVAVFLGRAAREDEVAELRPLTAAWHVRYMCEGALWWNFYDGYLVEDGYEPGAAVREANFACADEAKVHVGFNPCLCRPDDGLLGCSSSALGETVVLSPHCERPGSPYAADNVVLLSKTVPGSDDTCPDGSHRAECADRQVAENFVTMTPPAAWSPLSKEARAELDRIGTALAARPDFWEAAADRMLRRLVGWWQVSFRHPDTDLPEVRALLADLLRGGTSLREVEQLMMTSQLYAAPAAPPPAWRGDGEPPPWTMGPTKLLAAEPWLDTLLVAVGEKPGSCDVRGLSVEGYLSYFTDWSKLEDPASSLDAITGSYYYIDAVTALGGCRSGIQRPSQSNIGLAFAQGEHARVACSYASQVVPEDVDLRTAAERLVWRLWARPPADDELDQLVAEMNACLAAAAAGDQAACTDPEYAVRWLCQRLADSTQFATY